MKIIRVVSPLSLIFILFLNIGCQKNVDSPIIVQQSPGKLYFHLHTNIDSAEVAYGDTVMDAAGRRVSLSLAQFYMSGIRIKKTDGTFYTINNAYLLKKTETEVYLVGSVPPGNYLTVSFNVGIDSATNAKDPASYTDATNVLSSQIPSMWFGSVSQGYIFLILQGKADTSASHNGPLNLPFQLKIGSNALLRNVTLPVHSFSVSSNQDTYVHITCDYGKLIENLDLGTENNTDSYTTNPALAKKVADNIPNMFRYEE
jgi:hypothetical protein